MRQHIAAELPEWWFDGSESDPPNDEKGWPKLAANLAKIEALNPDPTWKNWNKFSRNGAKAAREGRRSGVREACRRCHQVYRRGYIRDHRMRKLPGAD